VQIFWPDSDYMDKIDIKKNFKKKILQCLALPKDCQKCGEVQKKCPQIFSKLFFYLLISYKNIPKMSKMSKNCNGKWMQ
jgi:hypothetical protein